jgi:ATP-dependent helicase HrpA
VLSITYPPELPISQRHDDLLAAIEANQVVVVAGETGSGKSTQLPKLCLELGRGAEALIGHTQPRRLAARTIAERVAEELGTRVGETVGYTVRFNDQVGPQTRIKVMTDGILLAEIPRDRQLRRYDTIIIDEAHERSLNIDFILGYLKALLPRRPDLKLIVTSATIDTERMASHFDNAPVVEVTGRTYPVEVRYRPLDDPSRDEPLDQNDGIKAAVHQLWHDQNGDILVFCSGEREIRDAAEAVGELKLAGSEILPLYARLSAAEQHRVFQGHAKRRVVIATNVAETSLTVPGIRAVVDTGTARISRYSNRTKVQRLPIEDISQASANQRSGRCGRLGPGICVRLYSQDSFEARPLFTEPEIKRTNLASVILQMASLGLGPVEAFPFLDPPEARSIRDGIELLHELDAVLSGSSAEASSPGGPGQGSAVLPDSSAPADAEAPSSRRAKGRRRPSGPGTRDWLTPIGRQLARLPVDPRFGRMLLEADGNSCLDELLIIVAGLSVEDPRERPSDAQALADDSHRRFADAESDFLSYVNLWDYVTIARRERSHGQFRRMCRREYLNYNRLVEWQDIHTQLRQVARELGLHPARRRPGHERRFDDKAHRNAIHQAILTGLLSQIGVRQTADDDKRGDPRAKGRPGRGKRRPEFLGPRSIRFAVAPGSALAAEPPEWVMAAELVETSRLWARVATGIDPAWAEHAGEHVATFSYGEPWWDPDRGAPMVKERVTLYGLTLAANRPVQLGTVDQRLARELFIHHALVEGEWDATHEFLSRNRELIETVEAMEARSRRRDLLVEHRAIFAFYDDRIPADVVSAGHFEAWWRRHRGDSPRLLDLSLPDLLNPDAEQADHLDFPDSWHQGDLDLELAYEFDPASPLDGLQVIVPVEVLNQLDAVAFQWSVPGFRAELISSLIRSLPKASRRWFVPAAETTADVLPQLDPERGPLLAVLAHDLGKRAGLVISPDEFDLSRVPAHLQPTFRIVNERYELLAEGKDVEQLQRQLADDMRSAITELTSAGNQWERRGLTQWDFGRLPRLVETGQVKAYPALVDEGDSVAIRLQADEAEQADLMWLGVRRLLRLNLASPVRQLDRLVPETTKLRLINAHVQSRAEWYNDVVSAALDDLIASHGGPPWAQTGFEELVALARRQLPGRLEQLAAHLTDVLEVLDEIHTKLDRLQGATYQASTSDIRAHLARLTYPGMLAGIGLPRLADVIRYLTGVARRLDALARSPQRDLDALATCRRLDNELATLARNRPWSPELEELTWLLEELRVSLFAQSLGTTTRVSEKRIRRALNQLRTPTLVG